MISAGILTDKVTPLARIDHGRGASGERIVEWLPLSPRAAKVSYLRGARALDVQEVWMAASISVLMRYSPTLTEQCRLRWDGRDYQIDSLNRNRADGSMTVTASRISE